VVALRACRWSRVVRVASRFLGVRGVLGIVVRGRSKVWAQEAVRVGLGVVLGSVTGVVGVPLACIDVVAP